MTREQILASLQAGTIFDLIIIGGGATGCGIAVDAASRGLRVALLEQNDIAEGTSSRSTKLVHGGVRYLEKAVKQLDRAQYALVKEGLHERGLLLKNAPHLAHPLAFVTPLYRWVDVPQVVAGLKLYDLLAGKMGIGHSRFLTRRETLKRFPSVKAEGLKAGVLYYDGQFNDARMAVALAVTAQEHGAVVANHLEVTRLLKTDGRICSVTVTDRLSGGQWRISTRGAINATGPFADRLRNLDDPQAEPIISASSGVHLVLAKRFAQPATGLMIPKTEDGRILFVLPWQGHTLIGTTDDPARISEHPQTTDEEIDYLLRHVRAYFEMNITRADIRSYWSGLRPLVADPKTADTSNLLRDHVISLSPGRLLTIAGGKWTSYRRMAEDTLNQAISAFDLTPARPCQTDHLPVAGGENFDPAGGEVITGKYGFAGDIAAHLNQAYGSRANLVADLAGQGLAGRLHPEHPFIDGEVIYAVTHELAVRAIDILTRRLPLSLVDMAAAAAAAPRVIELMSAELGWDLTRCREEQELIDRRLTVAL